MAEEACSNGLWQWFQGSCLLSPLEGAPLEIKRREKDKCRKKAITVILFRVILFTVILFKLGVQRVPCPLNLGVKERVKPGVSGQGNSQTVMDRSLRELKNSQYVKCYCCPTDKPQKIQTASTALNPESRSILLAFFAIYTFKEVETCLQKLGNVITTVILLSNHRYKIKRKLWWQGWHIW